MKFVKDRHRHLARLLLSVLSVFLLSGCADSAGGVNIWSAAKKGDATAISRYVRSGGDINTQSSKGVTPLLQAFIDENFPGYELLLKNGADPNLASKDGRSVMVMAGARKDTRWLSLALAHGGDPDLFVEHAVIGRRGPPLHSAIRNQSSGGVEVLLENGADVNYVRHDWPQRGTALIAAVYAGPDMVLLLLKNGADWKLSAGGTSFLDEFKKYDKVEYKRQEDRDNLQAAHDWLKNHGAID